MATRRRGAIAAAAGFAAAVAALFAWNVARSFFLTDDAFISFRYADHLARGWGLVWNFGERVEGYTNFLWVLILAAGLRAGVRAETLAPALGIAAGAGVLATLAACAARRAGWQSPWTWLAPLALASNRSFTAWCSGGLETMAFTLLVLTGYAAWLAERRRRAERPIGSALLLATATLMRPEGALFAAVALAGHLLDVARARRSRRSAAIWTLPYASVVASHVAWRLAYYGEWLPNTFYAKVAGAWWDQGLRYIGLFASDYRAVWLLPPIALALLPPLRAAAALPLAATAAYLGYVAYIGGDRFEFRFLIVLLPLVYAVATDGLWRFAQRRGRAATATAAAGALLLLGSSWSGSFVAGADEIRHGIAGLGTMRAYAARRADEGRFLGRLVVAGTLPADTIIAVGGAGALPYYSRLPTVDRLGINDAYVARLPLAARGVVAHEREAPYDYLLRRRVVMLDVFNRLVFDENPLLGRPREFHYDGAPVPLRAYFVDGRWLVFGTLVTDAELERRFAAF